MQRPMDEETAFLGLNQGCPTHGEEYIHECSMCGREFCARCFRGSTICSECAEMAQDDDLDDEPDFEDVPNLKALLPDDEDVEKMLEEDTDTIPPEDLEED